MPSKALGLELDPSHMVWLGIDYIQEIYDYSDRIYHVHAKDIEIDRKLLSRVGIYGQVVGEVFGLGHGWWRGRAPGWGEVDWPRFVTARLLAKPVRLVPGLRRSKSRRTSGARPAGRPRARAPPAWPGDRVTVILRARNTRETASG